jgi:hypothetical protein
MLRATLLVLLGLVCATAISGGAGSGAALAHPSDSALDQDHDGVNDPPAGPDNCAGEDAAFNSKQTDTDGDGKGDACDIDDDGDAIDDALDNCRLISNQAQSDIDGDNVGDACDIDDDGDGFTDSRDNCAAIPNAGQADTDGDGTGDACEDDAPAAPDAGPTPAPAPPDAPLEVELRLGGVHRTGALGAGLAVPVSCSQRCVLTSRLRVGSRTARQLGLSRVLGTGEAALDGAGQTYVFVGLTGRTLRRVRAAGSVRAQLIVSVTDASGAGRVMTRRLTIRR